MGGKGKGPRLRNGKREDEHGDGEEDVLGETMQVIN